MNLFLRIWEVSLKCVSLASKSRFTYYGGGWDLKLRPGLTPRCSQGGWGWPPTAAWDWEEGQKVGKGTTACFAEPTPLHAQFPALPRLPCHFTSARYTAFFETHHSTSIHIWSSSFDTNFTLVTKIKVKLFSFTCFSILFLAKTGLKSNQRHWNLAYYKGLGT